jgi:hypothetical protein
MADIRTPISPDLMNVKIIGGKFVSDSASPEEQSAGSFFGPMESLKPIAPPAAAGRAFDYPVGVNMLIRPRQQDGRGIDFDQLRALAENLGILRLLIETRKDQMAKMNFQFQIRGTENRDGRCEEVENFLRFPQRRDDDRPEAPRPELDWYDWSRMLDEDMLVIDAATVCPRFTRGGKLFSLDIIDGATIKRNVNAWGRTPSPPAPAYQQIIKGMQATDYTADELIYRPRNRRSSKLYGYSPVEQIVFDVNTALRRALSVQEYYTHGSMTDLLFGCPTEWQPDQIDRYEQRFNELLSGNTAQRRQARFLPGDVKPFNTKEAILKDDFDEWLARIVCFAFSVSPQPFVKEMNRATAQTAQEAAITEGLQPLMQWKKSLLEHIVAQFMGYPELELVWMPEKDPDPKDEADIRLKTAQAEAIEINQTGVLDVNEARTKRGMELLTPEALSDRLDAIAPQYPPMFATAGQGGGQGQGEPKPGENIGGKPGNNEPPAFGKLQKKKTYPVTHGRAGA